MTPPGPVLSPFRATVLLAALAGAASPAAHAGGRNHDLQPILIPSAVAAVHDHAAAPAAR